MSSVVKGMAFSKISTETVTSPAYGRKPYVTRRGSPGEHSSKEPTGATCTKVFDTFRCTHCRALAVVAEGEDEPTKCLKCHA